MVEPQIENLNEKEQEQKAALNRGTLQEKLARRAIGRVKEGDRAVSPSVGRAIAGGVKAGEQIKSGNIKGAKKTLKKTGSKLATDYAKKVAWGLVLAPEGLTTLAGLVYLNIHMLAGTFSGSFKMSIIEIMGVLLIDLAVGLLIFAAVALLVVMVIIPMCNVFGSLAKIGSFFGSESAGFVSDICDLFDISIPGLESDQKIPDLRFINQNTSNQ